MFQPSDLSPRARLAPESGIVAVWNHGRLHPDLIALWAGEGDRPTPDFICDAAARSLKNGDTFYTWQRGVPELRSALAEYHAALFNRPFRPEQFFVTGSGMQSIQIAVTAATAPGDELIYLSPAWPNAAASTAVAGAVAVPVVLDAHDGGWQLDMGRLEAAITQRTRAIFINSPSNPTGWTASREELEAILAIARRHRIWIIADEIYNRYFYEGERAPSFFDVADDDDLIMYVNSFSKNWSMTGWRVGWIVAPEAMGQVIENLIQYSTSGVAHFMQMGAVAALTEGEQFVADNLALAAAARDRFCDTLLATNRVSLVKPRGSFYAFFAIDGVEDTMQAAKDIVDATGVGLAPGTAFGPGGEAYMRACFFRRVDQVGEAADRLADYLRRM